MQPSERQKSSETFGLQRYLGMVRRRHLYFLIPMFVGWLAVWGMGWVLPARYKSSTMILVEQPTMPRDYVKPNVNEDFQERLQNITQQILSRTRLLHIIDELNMYTKDRRHLSPDEIVEQMRKDIDVELVQDSDRRISAFKISFSAQNPSIAQQVTSRLTSLFINENLEVRQQQSEGTTKFLEDQLETARQNLAEQEEKVRAYKAQHIGELPNQLESNLQILSGLQSQLQTEEHALDTAKQQQVYLETLRREYQTLRVAPNGPAGAPMGLSAIDQELDRLKAQLADFTSRYKDRFPEVRKLKQQIAAMEKMRDQILADPHVRSSDVRGAGSIPDGEDVTNQPQLLQLQGQLRANQIEIKNHAQTVSDLKSKINDYQARLNQEPVREQQLADMTRGYDQSKTIYDELLRKKNESAMATSMELLQQGEHFRIIDPPSLPLKPSFPNRLKFCGIGIVVGLLLGSGVAGGAEVMDDRVYSEQELKGLLPVLVISEIPVISTAADEQGELRKLWLGWAAAAVAFTTILAGSAISYLIG
jgi:polysaccharide chain length determinant protein (PEP-CTERM system associated)